MPAVLRHLFLLSAIGWAAVLYYLSAQPGIDVQPLFTGQDKVFHTGAYGVLGFLILGAMKPATRDYSHKQMLLAAGLAGVYGILDEFHQYFVPGRSSDPLDVLADASGGILGVVLMVALTRRLAQRRGSAASG